MDALEVLKWPYGEFGQMDLSRPFTSASVSKAPLDLGVRGPSEKRLMRTEVVAKNVSGGSYVSATDRNKGHVAEVAFAKAAEDLGYKVYSLPYYSHNYLRHIDYEVEAPNGLSFWVDVKAPKALRKILDKRNDPYSKPQDRYACLELNPKGSLYGGHADYIAFGLTDGTFVLADRLKIIEITNSKLDGCEARGRSAWPETALWAPYVRSHEGHHLVMTYMDLHDLSPAIKYYV